MGMKFSIQPHQDMSKPTDGQVQQVADHEDRIFMDSLREFDRMQQRSMQRLAEMIESDPKLRALHEAARRYDHEQKFGHMDFSKLEERVSDTFDHTSGVVRGVVQRYPRMSDNLPRDGRIKVDVAPGKRMVQTDVHLGDATTEDLSMAMVTAAFGLSGEQLGVIPAESGGGQSVPEKRLSYIDEAAYMPQHLPVRFLQSEKGPSGCPVGPSGRALRVSQKDSWSAERRDRAATPAHVRKKLRDKTRAQKKARRKQR